MDEEFLCNQEIIVTAHRNLSRKQWDYLTGGAESETTLRRNRLGLDSLAFRPRVLVDVSKIDTSVELLGQRLRIPVFMAPIGSLQTIVPGGSVPMVKAAAEFGTLCFISSVSQPRWEETAAGSEGPKVFQLYLRGDLKWVEDALARVKKAGYMALCMTVDIAYYGNRERQMLNRWLPPTDIKDPNRINQTAMTWETIEAIRKIWSGPFIIKGIATPEDAVLAVEQGADVVYVSNHGGRSLDHGQGTINVLPEVVKAVAGRAEILIDGGFVRGSDVLKAISLGASAVGIGKLQGWALGAAGQAGLVRALEILEAEIITTMGLLGVRNMEELSPKYVCKAEPVTHPHELNTFVHMPPDDRSMVS